MADRRDLDTRLPDLLARYTAVVDAPFDAFAVADAAVRATSRRGWVPRWLPAAPVDRRTLSLLLAIMLLAVLVAALAVVGGRPLDPADELLRRSQAAYADPPPLTLVTTNGPLGAVPPWYTACGDDSELANPEFIRWRYDYNGVGTFRQACLTPGTVTYSGSNTFVGPPFYTGGFEIQGPAGHGVWNGGTWQRLAPGFLHRPPGAPLVTPLWLNWLESDGATIDCSPWTLGEVTSVAGRASRDLSCGPHRLAIDEASGLVLRREFRGQELARALELDVGTSAPDALFDVPDAGFSPGLTEGEVPIRVTLPLIGGGAWDSSSLRGGKAALLIQTDCHAPEACLSLDEFVAAVDERRDLRVAVISFAHAAAYPAAALDAAARAGVPVAVDDQTRWPRWEYPRLGVALFEPDGRLAAIIPARTPASLAAALDAHLDGSPIPTPPLGDGYFALGEPAPPLRGELLAGGRFALDALRGKPALVLLPPWLDATGDDPFPCSDSGREAVEGVVHAAEALGDEAALVIVALQAPFASNDRLAGWQELLSELDAEGGRPMVLAPQPDDIMAWQSLRGEELDCQGWTSPLVIVDGSGIVRVIDGDGASAVEMIQSIRAITR